MLKYPRHKLASGDITQFGARTGDRYADSIKGDIIGWYWRQMDQGLVEDINAFKTGLIVERNANDENRVDILPDSGSREPADGDRGPDEVHPMGRGTK